jgi:histidinol phosphatase-like PHP family hydrolase
LRGEDVRLGLEVEIGCDGELTVRDEDRQFVDIVLGAVHWLTETVDRDDPAACARAFLADTLTILQRGVDVLAHPTRRYARWHPRVPESLIDEIVAALVETRTAAEVNFHHRTDDRAFYARCIEAGVPLALGTDAHRVHQAGALAAPLALVAELSARRGKTLAEVLWTPPV